MNIGLCEKYGKKFEEKYGQINKKYHLKKKLLKIEGLFKPIFSTVKFIWVILLVFSLGSMSGLCYQLMNTVEKNRGDITYMNKKLEYANERILILSQTIDLNKMANISIDANMLQLVPTLDYQRYEWIREHNNYKNPLSEEEIWEIIMELYECDNNPNLILAIAQVESSFDKEAISKAGCYGLMQINPIHQKTFKFEIDDLFKIRPSIKIADELISYWQKKKKLSTKEILEKYLGCDSKKYHDKVMSNLRMLDNLGSEEVI